MGWHIEIRETRRAGEEVRLAADACRERWPVIVAVGGDGTVHGVANGILHRGPSEVVLGLVPIGTGNDFGKLLGFRPGAPDANLARCLDGRVRRFDVGRVASEYFINGLGVGFDAEVVRETLRMDRLSGFALYLVAVYRTFWRFSPVTLEVEAATHAERARLMMLEVAIGRFAGGGFKLAPEAEPDDGLFDVCLIREVSTLQFLRWVPRVIRGTHVRLPAVTMFRADRVCVAGVDAPLALHLDGELRLPRETEIEVSLEPSRLQVLCAR
jgi:YegS/Rv2252/BmrU family lipid kinase